VTRDRLLTRLGDGAGRRLTLVSAPAGFGKTTLLASWLARTDVDRAVAWLSLDTADSDPTTFWTGVATAVRGAVPGAGARASQLHSTSPVPTDVVVTALLNDLAEAPGQVWLVLDDYHLADDPEVAVGMTFLVEHLPPNTHVVLSTRADPDLPLARWRGRGELVEIRAGDLRFTSGEIATYLEEATSTPLSTEQVRALENRTEGWIAALQLAAISLEGRADVAEFIDGFAGDDRYVVDYLVEEVLTHQPPAVRDFLLRSAVLDRLCTPLCDAVTGGDDADRMLRTLERANLFLVALDDRRAWYRYHQLFADVLRARLRSEQPDLVRVLHQRASQWFEDHDLADPAIRHALAAGDVDRAAALVEVAMPAVRRHRQEALAHSWLRELPEHVIRRSPALAVLSAGLLLVAGDVDAVGARLDDAERAIAAAAVDGAHPEAYAEELRTLPATIAIYRASLAQAQGDVAWTARHAQRALDLAGPDDHLARGGAAGFLGLAAWADGDVSQALVTFGQAVESLRAAGNVVDELSGTVVLADLWRAAGRPRKARELCDQALRLAEARGELVARASAELHVALAELDIEVCDLESARRHLESAADRSRRTAVTESLFRSFVAAALLARADGDTVAALDHLDQAERLYRPGFFPDVRPIPALRARLRISAGDLWAAADWAREREVSADDPADHLREFDHLTLVRLLLAEHRVHPDRGSADAVLVLLDRLRKAAQASERAGSLVEIRVLTALALDAQGRRSQALTTLADAWVLAPEPESYLRLFLDEGTPMVGLLRAAARDPGVGHHARRILALTTSDREGATGAARPGSTPLADPLSEREQQVLGLLGSELSGPDIARMLFISPNTLSTHTKHIFTKLGVSSRRAAVLRARERGLLPPASG
jgi:LuxR family maltose regulon positive regulatory protein